MNERSHDEIKELIAAYALGALPDDEIRIVRAHILECDECMAEADDYLEAASSLALSVKPVEAPTGFEERVISRARGSIGDSLVRPLPSLRRRLAPAFAIGILSLLSLALVAVTFATRSDLESTERIATALLRSDGIELAGEAGAVGKLVETQEGATLVAAGLPEVRADRTFQLWFLEEGADPVSAGTFDASGDLSVLETGVTFEGFAGAAVTIEPAGGSDQPTSDPVISSG